MTRLGRSAFPRSTPADASRRLDSPVSRRDPRSTHRLATIGDASSADAFLSRRFIPNSQTFPKKEAALAAGLSEKVVAKAFKEGGKKGVEIEGAADTSGLTCFCTRMQSSDGDIKLLEAAMEGMNAVPDPEDPEEVSVIEEDWLKLEYRVKDKLRDHGLPINFEFKPEEGVLDRDWRM